MDGAAKRLANIARYESMFPASLGEGIARACGEAEFSDLTIRCREKDWPVHKVVVCTQSEYFYRAVTGEFLESQTGVIELHEDNIEHVDVMVKSFYRNDYDLTTSHGDPNLHLGVFKLADKCLLPGLKDIAARHFREDGRRCDIEQLATGILSVYDMDAKVGENLRSTITHFVATYGKDLFVHDTAKSNRFKELLRQAPIGLRGGHG